jgi:hypothetical protein
LYFADSEISAIREIDLETNQIKTIVGKTEMNGICRLDDPACDSLGLYEPSDENCSKIRCTLQIQIITWLESMI